MLLIMMEMGYLIAMIRTVLCRAPTRVTVLIRVIISAIKLALVTTTRDVIVAFIVSSTIQNCVISTLAKSLAKSF